MSGENQKYQPIIAQNKVHFSNPEYISQLAFDEYCIRVMINAVLSQFEKKEASYTEDELKNFLNRQTNQNSGASHLVMVSDDIFRLTTLSAAYIMSAPHFSSAEEHTKNSDDDIINKSAQNVTDMFKQMDSNFKTKWVGELINQAYQNIAETVTEVMESLESWTGIAGYAHELLDKEAKARVEERAQRKRQSDLLHSKLG